MRNWLRIGLFILSALLTSSISAFDDSDQIDPYFDLPHILKRGTINVALYKGELPPFVTWQGNTPVGMAPDIALRFAKAIGVKVHFVPEHETFDDIVKEVNAHHVDIAISMLSRTTDRAVHVAFTTPYLTPGTWLLVDRLHFANMTDAAIIKQFSTKNSYTYVSYPNSAYTHKMTEMTKHGPNLVVRSTKDKVDAVATHKVNACMIDALNAGYWLGKHPELLVNIRPVKIPNSRDQLAMAVPYSSPILLSTANVFIDTMHLDGTMDQIVDQYFKGIVTLGKK